MNGNKGIVALLVPFALGMCFVAALSISCAPAATAISESQRQAIRSLSETVDRANLESLMGYLSINRNAWQNPGYLEEAQDFIQTRLESYGYAVMRQPIWVQSIRYYNKGTDAVETAEGPFYMDNIIGEKPGTDSGLAPVLVCAHHDAVANSPGADDNGSGCAGVLEIARVFSGASFDRTVRFCFFGFEENGMIGSTYYAETLAQSRLPDSAIVLEMIGFTSARENPIPLSGPLLGFPSAGDFIGAIGASESRSLVLDFLSCAADFAPGLPVFGASLDSNLGSDPFLQDSLRSDHAPFAAMGVPAIMVSDTANMREGNHYHQPEDAYETLDFAFMAAVTRAAAATAAVRAGIRP